MMMTMTAAAVAEAATMVEVSLVSAAAVAAVVAWGWGEVGGGGASPSNTPDDVGSGITLPGHASNAATPHSTIKARLQNQGCYAADENNDESRLNKYFAPVLRLGTPSIYKDLRILCDSGVTFALIV